MINKEELYLLVIQEEIKAQNLYERLAKALNKEDSSRIFENLIKIEKIHEEKISEIFQSEFPKQKLTLNRKAVDKIPDAAVLKSPESAFRYAIENEEKAETIYLNLAEAADDETVKQILLEFAEDENNHRKLLEDEMIRLDGLLTWFDASELNGLMED